MERTSVADRQLIALLNDRDGLETAVVLIDGRRFDVRNIAWGYDVGDEYAHVTTNVSPRVDATSIDVFYTAEVVSAMDANGAVLYPG